MTFERVNISRGSDWAAIRVLSLLVLVFVAATGVGVGQSNSNTSNTSNSNTASPTPAPSAIPVSGIVTEAEAAATRVAAIRSEIEAKPEITAIENGLPELRATIDERDRLTAETLSGAPTLDDLRTTEREWQADSRQLASWRGDVQTRLATLERFAAELSTLEERWQLSLQGIQAGAAGEDAAVLPPEILERVNETLSSIAETRKQVESRQTALLAIQTRTSELERRVKARLAEITTIRERTLTNLFIAERPTIWNGGSEFTSLGDLLNQTRGTIREQFIAMREYFAQHRERFAFHFLLFLVLTGALFWARERIRPYIAKEPKLETAAQVFAVPPVTALILSIIFSAWIYTEAPRALSAVLGALALVPVVILLRRLVDRPLFIFLNALVVLFFIDRFRDLLAGQPFTVRIVFLAEMLGAMLFLVWFLRTKSVEKRVEARHHKLFRSVRKVIPFALAIFAAAFIANAFGFVALSYVIGNGALGSAYAALVLYTALQIAKSLLTFALRVTPLARLRAVQEHRTLIRTKVETFLKWLAVILWVLATLNLFSVRQTVSEWIRGGLAYTFGYGSIEFTIGGILLFIVTVYAAVLISRVLRFFLEEDVYPRVDLGAGISYAVSTVLHYAVIVGGFMIAIAALGVDFSKFAIVAGAVGIGIGFGLQNIINNFVSGLILLFERPVKVNDTVQIGEHTGTLTQIGLRASVLRKVDGSDVIVPNSQLISEEVINWTMQDERRRIDIPVGVAYGTDPAVVTEILAKIPERYELALQDPPPKVLFTGMGESSLDFELRVWSSSDGWVGLRSDLVTDVYNALTEAGIEIPFPQRDLNLRSIDSDAAAELKKT